MNAIWIAAWTLLHFIWQGALVAVVLAVVLQAMRRQSAQRRYVVAVAALALMAALPVLTALRLASAPSALPVQERPEGAPGPEISASSGLAGSAKVERMESRPAFGATQSAGTGLTVSDGTPGAQFVAASLGLMRAWGDRIAPAVVIVWLSGVLLLSLRLLGGWRHVRRLTTTGTSPVQPSVAARLEAIASSLGVTRSVRLVESALVQVPAVIGWLRPVLLMPLSVGTGLSVRDLELLLAHELAHIRRHDYFINVLQTIVETALFYHPAIWWVSRQIRQEREHCCDDIAAAFCGNRKEYAEALVRLETLRRPAPLLAAAANGGSLVRRIRRLIDARADHLDGRARWSALPLAVVALAGIIAGTRLNAEPRPVSPMMTPEGTLDAPVVQQRGNARPDTVVRYAGPAAPLGRRVEWATAGARSGRSTYWIGYAIAGDPDRGYIYMNRHVPVVMSGGGGIFTGSMRFTNASGLIISGVALDSLIGPRSPSETIVMFGFRNTGGRATLDRIQLSSGMLPVHFDGRALYWLGDAGDAESMGLVRRLFDEVPSRNLKHDLITVTGAHLDAPAVLTQLRGWLASSEAEETRANAAEELARVRLPAAVGLLARIARDDRSSQVRREAAEALGEAELPEAGDTLARLVDVLQETSVAREAIEALGERHEPAAFDALVRIAWGERALELQREAVETMGESRDERRLVEVERAALTHRYTEVRREAVETLGEIDDVPAAIRILRDVINQDAVSGVREEAVQTLGEIDDPRAFALLVELARNHRDVEVRKEAISALSDSERRDEVLDLLREMIQDQSSESVVRAGVEALGQIEDTRAVQLLESIAARHRSSEIQREAVSALGSAAPEDAAWRALEGIAFSHSLEEVQRAAVEELGGFERDGVAALLERVVTTHPRPSVRIAAIEELGHMEGERGRTVLERMARDGRDEALQLTAIESYAESVPAKDAVVLLASLVRSGSRNTQIKALEELTDLEENAGIPTIIEVARAHPDLELRRVAMEHLGDSDDPRAHAELARLLRK